MLLLRRILVPTLSLLALLSTAWLAPKLRRLPGGTLLNRSLDKVRSRELNLIDLENLNAGYYEGLLNQSVGTTSLAGFLAPPSASPEKATEKLEPSPGEQQAPFLLHEYMPNVDVEVPAIGERIITNRFALADREYTLEKPSATYRIAFLGDSVVRGYRVTQELRFESLLEEQLNRNHTTAQIAKFEVLNFAVDGYRITQILDVALERASAFQPDAYLIAITELTVQRKWGAHVLNLLRTNRDLKYDYLKRLVNEAGLDPREDPEMAFRRLSPHRLPTFRWVFGELRALSEKQGAPVILVLISSLSDLEVVRIGFRGIPEIAREIGLPLLDLTDTFEDVADLDDFRIGGKDRHPNGRGHRLLYENLYRKILADRQISRTILSRSPKPWQVKAPR